MRRSAGPRLGKAPWIAAMALGLIWIGVIANWNWLWGLFFLLWGARALRQKVVFLLEPVERDAHPLLFWLITISWLILGVLMLAIDVFPSFGGRE